MGLNVDLIEAIALGHDTCLFPNMQSYRKSEQRMPLMYRVPAFQLPVRLHNISHTFFQNPRNLPFLPAGIPAWQTLRYDREFRPMIINNLIVNIVENSYGKDCIVMGNEYYKAIKATKKENYQKIYFNEVVEKTYKDSIRPMFHLMYEKLLADLQSGNENTIIYKHHIHFVNYSHKSIACLPTYLLTCHCNAILMHVTHLISRF